jgi:hypothetical protein
MFAKKFCHEANRSFLNLVNKFGTYEAVASALRDYGFFPKINRSTISKLVQRAREGRFPTTTQALIIHLLGNVVLASPKEAQLLLRLESVQIKLFEVETELRQVTAAVRAGIPKCKQPPKLKRKRA